MYYEENVIGGVLCWREDPDGEWIPFTPRQFTERVCLYKVQAQSNREHWPAAEAKLKAICIILNDED